VHEFFAGDDAALDRRLSEPCTDEPPIDEPLPHQLADDAPICEMIDAVQREQLMREAVDRVRAPGLTGRCFIGHRTR